MIYESWDILSAIEKNRMSSSLLVVWNTFIFHIPSMEHHHVILGKAYFAMAILNSYIQLNHQRVVYHCS